MLTQRTVADFQVFLTRLMHQDYLVDAVLNPGVYYNKLYGANVPRTLLDTIARRVDFSAFSLPLYLYEGHAIAESQGRSRTTDDDRAIGAAYLLYFIGIALKAYEAVPYDHRFCDREMRTLLDDLHADGYNYNGGNVFDMTNGDCIRPIPLDGDLRGVAPKNPEPPKFPAVQDQLEESRQEKSAEEDKATTHRKRDIGLLVVVVLGTVTIIATIFQPDLNHWLKSVWFHLWR
jgi:hypothetical protein